MHFLYNSLIFNQLIFCCILVFLYRNIYFHLKSPFQTKEALLCVRIYNRNACVRMYVRVLCFRCFIGRLSSLIKVFTHKIACCELLVDRSIYTYQSRNGKNNQCYYDNRSNCIEP